MNSELDRLTSNLKLERDKAFENLLNEKFTTETIATFINWIEVKMVDKSELNNNLGCLLACDILLTKCDNLPKSLLLKYSDEFVRYHNDNEFRIRIKAGENMGHLCKHCGIDMFKKLIDPVKNGIKQDLTARQEEDDALHDTEGWKSLETWIKCLENLINGLGDNFKKVLVENNDVFPLIFQCVKHKNRFIRETCYNLMETIFKFYSLSENENLPAFYLLCDELAVGLSDNWSQVRMAASKAGRQLLMSIKSQTNLDIGRIYSKILPPICLNRHYLAEGVRIYNQSTWKDCMGDQGRKLLVTYLNDTIAFLVVQCDADNHAVREAACHCLSELAEQLPRADVRPHFPTILSALQTCFLDDSWPVRDVACIATGRLIIAFSGDEGVLYKINDLIDDMFLKNLDDSIVSVREGAADILAGILRKFSRDNSLITRIYEREMIALKNLPNQKTESVNCSGLDKNRSAIFGVVTGSLLAKDSECSTDDARHSNQQMYSCGSLAPKMKKRGGTGGCHDGIFQRESDIWEKADGAVMWLMECSNILTEQQMNSGAVAIVEAVQLQHYPHFVYFVGTVCNYLRKMYFKVGKQQFKMYYIDSLVLPVVEVALIQCSKSNLTVSAALELVKLLRKEFGQNIIRGRLEMYSPSLLMTIEQMELY